MRVTASNFCGSTPWASKISSLKCARRISQTIKFPAPPSLPNEITWLTLHSKDAGDSATLGGLILIEGNSVKPAFTNSFTPFGYSQLANDACSTIPKLTILTTTSGTSRTFWSVCFAVLSRTRLDGEKIRMGGLVLNKLKK